MSVTGAPFITTPITPVTIPSSDTTRYGRTIITEDFPVFSSAPKSVKHVCQISVYGYNGSGGSTTVYWKMYRNNDPVANGALSGIANLNYYSACCGFYNVSPGDNLEVSIWGSATTNVTVDGHQCHIMPTRIIPTDKPVVDVTEQYVAETPTAGTGVLQYARVNCGGTVCDGPMSALPYKYTYPVRTYLPLDGFGMSRVGRGDMFTPDGGYSVTTATQAHTPRVGTTQILDYVTYREILL